jgi:hypothetical protein
MRELRGVSMNTAVGWRAQVFKLMKHAGVEAGGGAYEGLVRCAMRAGDSRFRCANTEKDRWCDACVLVGTMIRWLL